MNFINPYILFGLILAGIPIIIHFLNLRKLRTIEFSSIRFLKQLQKSHIRKLKIQQWILLLLRVLTIVFLVLAFARPITTGHLPGLSKYAQSSIIVLFDNSPSMNLSDQYGNRFNYAKRVLKKLIDNLNSRDEIIIIPMADLQPRDFYSFSSNRKVLNEQITNIKVGYKIADFSKSLSVAIEILRNDAHFLNKEIFVISDNQEVNFIDFDKSIVEDLRPAIYFINIASKGTQNIKNISIDTLFPITRIYLPNKPLLISAKIKNHSSEVKQNHMLSLELNGIKVAQKNINLRANSMNNVEISANLSNSNVIMGKLETENDALNEDNRRYFGLIMPIKPKICVVANEENPFLSNALGKNFANSYCQFTTVSPYNFNGIDLKEYDLIILTNYKSINTSKLTNYLSEGGRAILFADESLFDNLELKSAILNASQINSYIKNQENLVTQINTKHPIFEGVFANEYTELPDKIVINKEISDNSGMSVISTNTGSLLGEYKYGKGLFFYFSVAPNLEYSNFPTSSLFPVTIYRSVLYLSSLPELSFNASVGQNLQVQIPEKYATSSNFTIIDPNGNQQILYAPNLPSGITLNISGLDFPGNYLIQNSNKQPVGILSVNISNLESNLNTKKFEDINALLKDKFKKKITVANIEEIDALNKQIQRVRTGSELWQIFLVMALITALTEMVIQRATKEQTQ